MPIPQLQPDGLLPPGIHECTLEEIKERFGAFSGSDRRPRLFSGLASYVSDAVAAGIGDHLIVDGSFVTSVDNPNDIDVLLVLKSDCPPGDSLPPFQYNASSRRYVKKNYGLDFYFGFPEDPTASSMLSHFAEVRHLPGAEKGMLKVKLC